MFLVRNDDYMSRFGDQLKIKRAIVRDTHAPNSVAADVNPDPE